MAEIVFAEQIRSLIETPWVSDVNDDCSIICVWPDTNTQYTIRCPPSIRSGLIHLQQMMCHKYNRLQAARYEIERIKESDPYLIT